MLMLKFLLCFFVATRYLSNLQKFFMRKHFHK